jgi:hypothetical protein
MSVIMHRCPNLGMGSHTSTARPLSLFQDNGLLERGLVGRNKSGWGDWKVGEKSFLKKRN